MRAAKCGWMALTGGKLHAIYCSWHSNMKPGTQTLTCVHLYAGTHRETHTHITNTQHVCNWLLTPCFKYWFLCNVCCFRKGCSVWCMRHTGLIISVKHNLGALKSARGQRTKVYRPLMDDKALTATPLCKSFIETICLWIEAIHVRASHVFLIGRLTRHVRTLCEVPLSLYVISQHTAWTLSYINMPSDEFIKELTAPLWHI